MPCPGKIAASARSFPLSSAKQRVDRRPEVGSSAEMVMITAGDDVQRHLTVAPAGPFAVPSSSCAISASTAGPCLCRITGPMPVMPVNAFKAERYLGKSPAFVATMIL